MSIPITPEERRRRQEVAEAIDAMIASGELAMIIEIALDWLHQAAHDDRDAVNEALRSILYG